MPERRKAKIVELDVNALQMLQEIEPETGLWPCSKTCNWVTCGIIVTG